MKKFIAILISFALLFLTACTGAGNYKFTKESFPKVSGSASLENLAKAIVAAASESDINEVDELVDFSMSTFDAYKALCDKEVDFLLAYEPDAETLKYFKEKKQNLEMTEIVLDATVLVTSFKNGVDELTENQVNGIYSGRIKTWDEVGGEESVILPYQSLDGSAERELFDRTLNMGDRLNVATKDTVISSDGLFTAVSQYKNSKNAIGYATYSQAQLLANGLSNNSTVKLLKIDGIAPNAETVKNGEYPLSASVYAVIRKGSLSSSPERVLYNWVCSEQGRELAEREFY